MGARVGEGRSHLMTPAELESIGKARHGEHWCGPLADEIGWSFSHLWRIANGERAVSRKLELAVKNLKPLRKRRSTLPLSESP